MNFGSSLDAALQKKKKKLSTTSFITLISALKVRNGVLIKSNILLETGKDDNKLQLTKILYAIMTAELGTSQTNIGAEERSPSTSCGTVTIDKEV
jgi:hypothetical protein